MAVSTNPADFAAPSVKIGPNVVKAAIYLFAGAVAIAIAVPVALMSADAGMFEECYSACVAAAQ